MTGLLKKESGFPEARFNCPWSKCAGGCGSRVVTWDGYRVLRGTGLVSSVCVSSVCLSWGPSGLPIGAPVPVTKMAGGLCVWDKLCHGLSVRKSGRCPRCLPVYEAPAVSFRAQGTSSARTAAPPHLCEGEPPDGGCC